MNSLFVYFIPTIDETDGKLIYVAEPFIRQKYFEKAVIVMPQEFSIVLEEEEEREKEPSKIVKLTFWDLFLNAPNAPIFVLAPHSDLKAALPYLQFSAGLLRGYVSRLAFDYVNIRSGLPLC